MMARAQTFGQYGFRTDHARLNDVACVVEVVMSERARTIEWSDPLAVAAAATGKSGLEFLRAICDGTVAQPPIGPTLGFALVAADEGMARFRGQPGEYQYNPMGRVHGGWACTLLDSAMGSAVMSVLDRDTAYTTTQLSIHLTGGIDANTGPVVAEGRVIFRGGRVATAEGRLTDERGRLLAHGTTSCLLFPRKG
jgi:uncharacterized protein (TIGR00369 family)